MHSLPPNLSADRSRDPQKFSKWRKRASRLSHALENGSLNGDTENVQHMLDHNIERLRQLGGIIPSVSRGQFRRQHQEHHAASPYSTTSALNEDGIYSYYSTGGHRYEKGSERILTVERELEIDAEIHDIASELMQDMRTCIAEAHHGDDLIRRTDDLWEQTNEEPIMHASNRRAVALPSTKDTALEPDFSGNFSLDKDAAQYALDQLGYE